LIKLNQVNLISLDIRKPRIALQEFLPFTLLLSPFLSPGWGSRDNECSPGVTGRRTRRETDRLHSDKEAREGMAKQRDKS
jgi:hypothetical protein